MANTKAHQFNLLTNLIKNLFTGEMKLNAIVDSELIVSVTFRTPHSGRLLITCKDLFLQLVRFHSKMNLLLFLLQISFTSVFLLVAAEHSCPWKLRSWPSDYFRLCPDKCVWPSIQFFSTLYERNVWTLLQLRM